MRVAGTTGGAVEQSCHVLPLEVVAPSHLSVPAVFPEPGFTAPTCAENCNFPPGAVLISGLLGSTVQVNVRLSPGPSAGAV